MGASQVRKKYARAPIKNWCSPAPPMRWQWRQLSRRSARPQPLPQAGVAAPRRPWLRGRGGSRVPLQSPLPRRGGCAWPLPRPPPRPPAPPPHPAACVSSAAARRLQAAAAPRAARARPRKYPRWRQGKAPLVRPRAHCWARRGGGGGRRCWCLSGWE